jgi:hypothetical protein
MRQKADPSKITEFLRRFGRLVRAEGRVYLTGGSCAVLRGWRNTTIDVDLRLDPEPSGAFEAIARLKNELDLNVELASPQDFIPVPDQWRERSVSVGRFGKVDVFHFDFLSQALAKLERGHQTDLKDVDAMLDDGLVTLAQLGDGFEEIEHDLIRYPSIDAAAFRDKVEAFVEEYGHNES